LILHDKSRAHSSAGERSLHTGEVQGSIPCAPTRIDLRPFQFTSHQLARRDCRIWSMPPRKLIILIMSLAGGAIGLLAPVGVVKWVLQTEPEDAGILTLFFLPVWFLLVVFGLLVGRRLGGLATGGRRIPQR
jgi:hypothetical protein